MKIYVKKKVENITPLDLQDLTPTNAPFEDKLNAVRKSTDGQWGLLEINVRTIDVNEISFDGKTIGVKDLQGNDAGELLLLDTEELNSSLWKSNDEEFTSLKTLWIFVSDSFKTQHQNILDFKMSTDGYWFVHYNAVYSYPDLFTGELKCWMLGESDFAYNEDGTPYTPDANVWRKLVNWWNT